MKNPTSAVPLQGNKTVPHKPRICCIFFVREAEVPSSWQEKNSSLYKFPNFNDRDFSVSYSCSLLPQNNHRIFPDF
jgi:hypothetical protein